MHQRGDIVLERLTGKRAIVINVASSEEVTCRFGDGRLEDRYVFELEAAPSPVGWLMSLLAPFGRSPEGASAPLGGRVRPLVLRQPGAS